ncbi:FUSC family protein [Streptomyces sp. NPDC002573]|uniref:FUSC family protein n=1 Tax=Streptomyces sp. NPDC002573 TaxID=3364651 RepID=UPI003676BF99
MAGRAQATAHKEASITPGKAVSMRPLQIRDALRLGRATELWPKTALSVLLAMAVPSLVLLAMGHVGLMVYTVGGSTCALYGHSLPYAARARALACVVLGMVVSNGAGLATAAATHSTAVRVAVAALLAAAHKFVCDATRIGPPGNVVFTFVAAGCAFLPQRFADIPGHLALTLAAGSLAWTVCMAPGLVRSQEPERLAVARALNAAMQLARTPNDDPDHTSACRAAATTAAEAWRTVSLVPTHSPERQTLALLLTRAESGNTDPRELARWARLLRTTTPLPDLLSPHPKDDQVTDPGTALSADGSRPCRHGSLNRCHVDLPSALRPGSHLLLLSARVAVGCALAGWASMALGVGRPYWAVVAAASIFQSNLALTWRRALNRVFGNVVGLALFAALLPITRAGALALILAVLFFQVATEATISRGYWLGQVCIVQMSLLMPQFAHAQPAGELLMDRALDTLTGCTLGLLVALAITDRRAVDRAKSALATVNASHAAAARLMAQPSAPDPADLVHARCRLASALAQLREATEVASGEWRQRTLPQERIAAAEHESRQMLTLLAGSLSAGPPR